MKVLKNVHLVDGTTANVYLILNEEGVAVIDAGLLGYEKYTEIPDILTKDYI